jgi:AcrR family transcriptional regulator
MVLNTVGMSTSPTVAGPKRLSRAEQVERNRRLLLEAARAIFGEQGYAGATLDAIAEHAGFSKGVIYSQFDSKADLFLTLLEEQIDRRAESQLAHARSTVAERGVEGFLLEMMKESKADPAWRLVVIEFRVVAARDPILNDRYRRAHRRTIEGVVEAMEIVFEVSGRRPYLPLENLALAALAMETGAYLEEVAEPDAFTLPESASLFAHLIGLGSTDGLGSSADSQEVDHP